MFLHLRFLLRLCLGHNTIQNPRAKNIIDEPLAELTLTPKMNRLCRKSLLGLRVKRRVHDLSLYEYPEMHLDLVWLYRHLLVPLLDGIDECVRDLICDVAHMGSTPRSAY